MMAQDATPLIEAILTIIEAARAYLPPGGMDKDEFTPECSRRSTIRALTPLSPRMDIR